MAFAFLWRWLKQTPARTPDLCVVLYTRATCPLCDEAAALLSRYQKVYGFALESQDVDGSADLVREYGVWVPVVTINGQVRFRGHINEVLLKRMLEAR